MALAVPVGTNKQGVAAILDRSPSASHSCSEASTTYAGAGALAGRPPGTLQQIVPSSR